MRRFIYYIAVFYFLFFVDFLLWFTEADFCHPVHTRIRHVFLPLMTSARLISSSQHGCRFISCIVACVSVFFFGSYHLNFSYGSEIILISLSYFSDFSFFRAVFYLFTLWDFSSPIFGSSGEMGKCCFHFGNSVPPLFINYSK